MSSFDNFTLKNWPFYIGTVEEKNVLVTLPQITYSIAFSWQLLLQAFKRHLSNIFSDIFAYLPFLYSCVSFLGVLILLLCTPLGFARLFTVVGDLVTKPNFSRYVQGCARKAANIDRNQHKLAQQIRVWYQPYGCFQRVLKYF